MPTNDRIKRLFQAQNARPLVIPGNAAGVGGGFAIGTSQARNNLPNEPKKKTTPELLVQAREFRDETIKKLKKEIFTKPPKNNFVGTIDQNFGNTSALRNATQLPNNPYQDLARTRKINRTRDFTSKKPVFGQ